MKLTKYLKNTIESLNGSMIGIGIKEKTLIKAIENNQQIIECNLLNSYTEESDETGKKQHIKITKLREKFKKKKTDNIICNLKTVENFQTKFIYDSIYIGKKTVYIYIEEKDADLENMIRRYRRFSEVTKIPCQDGTVYQITLKKNMSKLKETIYHTIDSLIDMVTIISELLS